MKETFRIGTRGSKLALWQAEYVAGLLKKAGSDCEIIPIQTKGDEWLGVSISKIGSKGVFTREIEEKLFQGVIDIAVHSAKDMQSELSSGLEIIGLTEREKANDVLVSHKDLNPEDLRGIKIGTSSVRRLAFLAKYYPKAKGVQMRGNLQTRINKMMSGDCDVLMLAYAGVNRMGKGDLIKRELPTDVFVPAVGQGSIAVEAHTSLQPTKWSIVREIVNHPPTETCITAERAFLKTMQGGCSVPVFALAGLIDQTITLTGGVISLDGQQIVKHTIQSSSQEPETVGKDLGKRVLESGGETILQAVKSQMQN